jgi:hypothetical protein
MERQSTGIGAVLIALLTGLALGFPFGVSGPDRASSGSQSAVSVSGDFPIQGEHGFPQHTALDIIMDSFGADPLQMDKSQIWSQNNHWSPAREAFPLPLKIVVATVPDPIAPPLRQQFDDSIVAIQRAAEAAGFILDRLDLPWPTPNAARPADELANEFEIRLKEESSSSSETPGSAALSARKRAEAPPRASKGRNGTAKVLPRYFIATRGDAVGANRFESDPGLMLFRSTSETKPELLVVFLVGEVPTSGIHPKAMRSALDQTSWLCDWKKCADDPAANEVFQVAVARRVNLSFSLQLIPVLRTRLI